ncbi:T9SS sorting signal type C domain-containing protein [Flavobacterium microcysteis]|uniref:T9SS sorting signal type C domain-containing protein n=2 Tax=Flavobacterium microcysteis TaxID=2596891 RepID=A0A501PYX5_9FLAO|nr:T9SS sorting signal type C domain-containing protein [Flavobacterium microcysteis]
MNLKTTLKNQKKHFARNRFHNMKLIFGLMFCTLGFQAHSQYCEPLLDCTDDDLILNVSIGTLTNASTCGGGGYNNFTALAAPNLNIGSSYPISVTVGDGWSNESVSVWIDYNGNQIFEASEFTYIGTGSGNTVTGNITIPATVSVGTKRMRVRVAAVGAAAATDDQACDEESEYGETEDYTVNIQPALGIDDIKNQNQLVISNSNDFLNINSSHALIDSIELYDLTGKLIYQKANIGNNSSSLDSSSLGNQILILKILTSDQIVHVKKIAN